MFLIGGILLLAQWSVGLKAPHGQGWRCGMYTWDKGDGQVMAVP